MTLVASYIHTNTSGKLGSVSLGLGLFLIVFIVSKQIHLVGGRFILFFCVSV